MTELDPSTLERVLDTLRATIAERGLRALVLIDAAGQTVLLPTGEVVDEEKDEPSAEDPIVRSRAYTLKIDCGPCKTTGPHAGKRKCCVQIGGDYICSWVSC